MKTCTKCHKEKDLSEFSKNQATEDGLGYWCRGCFKAYRDARHADSVKAKPADWKQKTKDKAAYMRAWRLKNADHLKSKKLTREQIRKNYVRKMIRKFGPGWTPAYARRVNV